MLRLRFAWAVLVLPGLRPGGGGGTMRWRRYVGLATLLVVAGGLRTNAAAQQPDAAQGVCTATRPNGDVPPGERSSPGHHGNGRLWVSLWPDGVVVFKPGGSGFVLPGGSL